MNEPELAIQLPLEYILSEDLEPVAEITGPELGEEFEDFTETGEGNRALKMVAALRPNVQKLAITAEEDSFDGEDDVITFIETPSAPVYIPPAPVFVEKRLEKRAPTVRSVDPALRAYLASDEFLNSPLD
jgi:hypothetical protein